MTNFQWIPRRTLVTSVWKDIGAFINDTNVINCFQDWTADDFAPYCWWKGAGTETRTVYIKGGWYLLHDFGLWLGNTFSILQGRPSWRTWNCWCLLMEDVGFVPHFHSLWRWRCRVSVVGLSHLCWYVILAPIFTVMSLNGCSSCCRRW